jgi:hypothetical protein
MIPEGDIGVSQLNRSNFAAYRLITRVVARRSTKFRRTNSVPTKPASHDGSVRILRQFKCRPLTVVRSTHQPWPLALYSTNLRPMP